jgi:hypothetical protein
MNAQVRGPLWSLGTCAELSESVPCPDFARITRAKRFPNRRIEPVEQEGVVPFKKMPVAAQCGSAGRVTEPLLYLLRSPALGYQNGSASMTKVVETHGLG